MGSRAYIAKFERDGSGRLIYLGHGCYPDDAGIILLNNYQDEADIEALISRGSMHSIEPELDDCIDYHVDYREPREHCKPVAITGGTEALFSKPYNIGPEWLYAWTPDGWLAAPVRRDLPHSYWDRIQRPNPGDVQSWMENNQRPEWVQWRKDAIATQLPQPLYKVVQDYVGSQT